MKENKKSSFLPYLIGIGLILVAVFMGGKFLSTNNPNKQMQNTAMMKSDESNSMEMENNDTSMMKSDEMKEITIEAGNFYFSPSEINIKMGEQIKIILVNKEGTHDFVLDQFNVKSPVSRGGETIEIEFTADKKGTFEYYCSIGNHREMGMRGNFIVE